MLNYEIEQKRLLEFIEKEIKNIVPQKTPEQLYAAYSYVMSGGGKRIRPLLTMLSAASLNGNPDSAIMAGLAIEILHNFTLVHDDIMDNSSIRRGRQTVHLKWNEETAILTGDMMVGWAYSTLLSTKNEHIDELIKELTTALIEVCEGQQLDMEFNQRNDITLNDYIKMIELKTSALLRCCTRMGAIIGNCNEIQYKNLDEFALNFGIAFQIQDDILDMTANQLKFGKKIGQDIIEGKKSFTILKAAELANQDEDKLLIQKYMASKNGLSEKYIPEFKKLFDKLNIFNIGQNITDIYINRALNYIKDLPNEDYKNMLKVFINSLNKRVY